MAEREPNILDRLLDKIPGYRGFADKDARRGVDKALRDHVGGRLDALKRGVERVSAELVNAGQLEGLHELDRLRHRLGTCADRIRHAPYGESGWMDDRIVTAEELDRLHEHDLGVEGQVDALAEAFEALTAENAGDQVGVLRDRVEDVLCAIEKRDDILTEVFRCRS